MEPRVLTPLPFDIISTVSKVIAAVEAELATTGEPITPRERYMLTALATGIMAALSDEE